jgi:hypothetical protein
MLIYTSPLLFILGEKVAESREDERAILDLRDQSEQARPTAL